jgi:hypothetical protein
MDDAAPIPNPEDPEKRFEPGYGWPNHEEKFEHEDWDDWPDAWSLPSPLYEEWGPIESEATNAGDNSVDNHDYMDRDWGKPGKQHNRNRIWDD